jgi:hypothetical protein
MGVAQVMVPGFAEKRQRDLARPAVVAPRKANGDHEGWRQLARDFPQFVQTADKVN